MRIRIDHATICGSELEPLRNAFAEAGLATEYGGPHANGVTHMALLGFEDGSYLELIAPCERQAAGSPWQKLMLGEAGPGAWAVRTTDIHAELSRLSGAGIESSGPIAGTRQRPDGKRLSWETASIGPGSPGAILPFMIQDHTPREWRVQPSASTQDAGLIGVVGVVLAVRDLDRSCELFRRAYGWPPPELEDHEEFGARISHFENTPVMLATPLSESSWLTPRLIENGEIPAAFLLHTADLRKAAARFQLAGETKWFGSALAWFDPDSLSGVRLAVAE